MIYDPINDQMKVSKLQDAQEELYVKTRQLRDALRPMQEMLRSQEKLIKEIESQKHKIQTKIIENTKEDKIVYKELTRIEKKYGKEAMEEMRNYILEKQRKGE